MAKRNIFDELMEGVAAMKGRREGKITLRTFKVEPRPLPKVDSKLIKAGAATGVTEGRITRVEVAQVTIKPLADFPLEYELSDTGDSGAAWVESETRAPVALHYSAQSGGESVAYAIPMPAVLRELNLI